MKKRILASSEALAGLTSESKGRIAKVFDGGHEAHHVYDPVGIAPTVREMHGKVTKIIQNGDACGIATTIDTASKSTTRTSGRTTSQLTLGRWIPEASQTSTFSLRDFHARASQWLERGRASPTREALCFLKSLGYSGIKDHRTYSLRMSRDSFPLTRGEPSSESSKSWMNFGMTSNGKSLTLNTGSLRTARESSLSDILEENPDPKYFLSERAIKSLRGCMERLEEKGHGFRPLLIPITTKEEEEAEQ